MKSKALTGPRITAALVIAALIFVGFLLNPTFGPAIVAIAIVAIVPVIILFSLIEKRLIGGLTAGSLK